MKLSQRHYTAAFVLCTLCMCWLLLAPSSSFSSVKRFSFLNFYGSDKVVHFIMFFTESFLLHKSIEHRPRFAKPYITVMSFVFLFGLVTEVIQGLTYNTARRTFSLWDLLTDVFAAVVFCLVCYLVKRRKK